MGYSIITLLDNQSIQQCQSSPKRQNTGQSEYAPPAKRQGQPIRQYEMTKPQLYKGIKVLPSDTPCAQVPKNNFNCNWERAEMTDEAIIEVLTAQEALGSRDLEAPYAPFFGGYSNEEFTKELRLALKMKQQLDMEKAARKAAEERQRIVEAIAEYEEKRKELLMSMALSDEEEYSEEEESEGEESNSDTDENEDSDTETESEAEPEAIFEFEFLEPEEQDKSDLEISEESVFFDGCLEVACEEEVTTKHYITYTLKQTVQIVEQICCRFMRVMRLFGQIIISAVFYFVSILHLAISSISMDYIPELFCPGNMCWSLYNNVYRRPIVGLCGHTVCLQCVQNCPEMSCPKCEREKSFVNKTTNTATIEYIKKYRKRAIKIFMNWRKGEDISKQLCSECSENDGRQLRICLTCSKDELFEISQDELKLKMNIVRDFLNLSRFILCSGCAKEKHKDENHEIVKISDIKHSEMDIKKVTGQIMLQLIEEDGGFNSFCQLKKDTNVHMLKNEEKCNTFDTLNFALLFCPCHDGGMKFFDDDTHRPYTGRCGHTICKECLPNPNYSSCKICGSFSEWTTNFLARDLIGRHSNEEWKALEVEWRENYGGGICSKCFAPSRVLRVCVTCDGAELCSESNNIENIDVLSLCRHLICADCIEDNHMKLGHRVIKVDKQRFSNKEIQMATTNFISELFRERKEKWRDGSVYCFVREFNIEAGRKKLIKLLKRASYIDSEQCGYLGESIDATLTDKYAEYIDRRTTELNNEINEKRSICECTRLFEHTSIHSFELSHDDARKKLITDLSDAPGCSIYFQSNSEFLMKLHGNTATPTSSSTAQPQLMNKDQCQLCDFLNYDEEKHTADFYRQNWLSMVENIWNKDMPPLASYCHRCLTRLLDSEAAKSCTEYEMMNKQIIRIIPRYNCKYEDCLMKHREYWKYAIIKEVSHSITQTMHRGIGETDFNCQLQKIRMQMLAKRLENAINAINMREDNRETFQEKKMAVDTYLKELKTRWNNRGHEQSQCKCKAIWEKIEQILSTQKGDQLEKYQDLKNSLKKMAEHSLMENITGCPMNFNHGIVLDTAVLGELELIES
ncbi:unnamed protein product [Caenorhabditis brenneri]